MRSGRPPSPPTDRTSRRRRHWRVASRTSTSPRLAGGSCWSWTSWTSCRSITSPTLVCVGELDAVTPVEASQEIYDHLPADVRQMEVVAGVGHFPWLDDASERYWAVITDFIRTR